MTWRFPKASFLLIISMIHSCTSLRFILVFLGVDFLVTAKYASLGFRMGLAFCGPCGKRSSNLQFKKFSKLQMSFFLFEHVWEISWVLCFLNLWVTEHNKNIQFVCACYPTCNPWSERMVSNSDGLPKQFRTMKNLHHMIYGTFNGKGFLVLLLQLVWQEPEEMSAPIIFHTFTIIYILHMISCIYIVNTVHLYTVRHAYLHASIFWNGQTTGEYCQRKRWVAGICIIACRTRESGTKTSSMFISSGI